MIKFNLNDHVKVKLTPFGRQIHRLEWDKIMVHYVAACRQLPELPNYRPPTEDKDGWSTWQLWALMNTFGDYLHNGGQLPFETTIVLDDVLYEEKAQHTPSG